MFKLSAMSVLLAACMNVCAADFSFGLWGDMPYAKNNDGEKPQAVIDSINASDVSFSIFDGDFKDGSSRCDDALYAKTWQMFNRMHQPLVYVPGDNEWTDCHRNNNGALMRSSVCP